MKRVAFLVSRVVRTGPNTNMMAVLEHLPRDEIAPCVIALDDGSDPQMLEDLARLQIDVHQIPAGSAPARRRWLRERIETERIDVVLSCGLRADLFNRVSCPARRRGMIKQEPAFTPFGGALKTYAVRLAHLGILRGARRIISVSRHVHESLPRALQRRSAVVTNAVDLDRFRPPTEDERSAAREELGVPEDAEVVVFAGTLDYRKRPHLLLQPVRVLDGRRDAVRLVIAGDGLLREELVDGGDHVQVVGFQEDVRKVFWAGDVFALPSTHEGLPLAAMEAMACGLPLVLSDIAPHTELLEGSVGVGAAVDVTDAERVVVALERALDDLPTDAPRLHAMDHFGAKEMAAGYARVIDQWVTATPQAG